MAIHFSICAWKMQWTGAWWATVHGSQKTQIRLSISQQQMIVLTYRTNKASQPLIVSGISLKRIFT